MICPCDTTTTTRWPRVSTRLVRSGPRESRCRELTLGLSSSETFDITTDASSDLPTSLCLSLSLSRSFDRNDARLAHTRTRAINILYISAEILTMAARGYVQSGREKEGKRYGILRWERGACAVSARVEVVEAMRPLFPRTCRTREIFAPNCKYLTSRTISRHLSPRSVSSLPIAPALLCSHARGTITATRAPLADARPR